MQLERTLPIPQLQCFIISAKHAVGFSGQVVILASEVSHSVLESRVSCPSVLLPAQLCCQPLHLNYSRVACSSKAARGSSIMI